MRGPTGGATYRVADADHPGGRGHSSGPRPLPTPGASVPHGPLVVILSRRRQRHVTADAAIHAARLAAGRRDGGAVSVSATRPGGVVTAGADRPRISRTVTVIVRRVPTRSCPRPRALL